MSLFFPKYLCSYVSIGLNVLSSIFIASSKTELTHNPINGAIFFLKVVLGLIFISPALLCVSSSLWKSLFCNINNASFEMLTFMWTSMNFVIASSLILSIPSISKVVVCAVAPFLIVITTSWPSIWMLNELLSIAFNPISFAKESLSSGVL